jgi:hypothetical protein
VKRINFQEAIRYIKIRRKSVIKILIIMVVAFVLSAATDRVMYARQQVKQLLHAMLHAAPFHEYLVNMHLLTFISTMLNPLTFNRMILFFIFFVFLGLHLVIPIKKMYAWIFNYRYIVALAIFLFLVLNQYNGSSVQIFDSVIQNGQGSAFVQPIMGKARSIRSDEWLVATPNRLSAQFGSTPYGRYNYILRGTKTPNIAAGNMYLSYASLGNISNLGYFLFGQAYGQSIAWWGMLLLSILLSIEMCMIITKKRKLLSVAGGFLIAFSAYFQWWSFVNWIVTAQAAVVCGYYFLYAKKLYSKILLAIGLALSLACFIVSLYPAWQVPAGYLFLGILIWLLWDNRDRIKQMKIFDWIVLGCAFIFTASIVVAYLKADADYMQGIMTTVYPGKRMDNGGNFSLDKLFYGFCTPLFPFLNFANASEAGTIITFFPIPIILSLVLLIKSKFKDLLSIILLIFSAILASYICIGWPAWLTKITLMSYSSSMRAIDIFTLAMLYLLLASISRFQGVKKLHPVSAFILAVATTGLSVFIPLHHFTEVSIPVWYTVAASIFIFLISYFIMVEMSNRSETLVCCALIVVMLFSGTTVFPLQKGFDAIYSKPLAKEVAYIMKQNPAAKWAAISCGIVPQQFLVACGAPTIDSTNIIPNLTLWRALDPSGQYNQIYNRYAHVEIVLTEEPTSFNLIGADYMHINLSYDDVQKTGVSYFYSLAPLESKDGLELHLIYNEYGSYIYQIGFSAVK